MRRLRSESCEALSILSEVQALEGLRVVDMATVLAGIEPAAVEQRAV